MKNSFNINYTKKELIIFFEGQEYPFNLNDGDVGDFWHSFITNINWEDKDVNLTQENKDEEPLVSVYDVKDGQIDTKSGITIPKGIVSGYPDFYFGVDIFAECDEIYNEKGQASVIEYVNVQMKNDNPFYKDVKFEMCNPCETESPSLNNICLVCGSEIEKPVLVEIITILEGGLIESHTLLSGAKRLDVAVKIIRVQMIEWGHALPLDISNDEMENECYELLDGTGKEIKWESSALTECS